MIIHLQHGNAPPADPSRYKFLLRLHSQKTAHRNKEDGIRLATLQRFYWSCSQHIDTLSGTLWRSRVVVTLEDTQEQRLSQ